MSPARPTLSPYDGLGIVAAVALALLLIGYLLASRPDFLPPDQLQEIRQASLQHQGRTIAVSLPHTLPGDSSAHRDEVYVYRLDVTLTRQPVEPLGVYIPKLSRVGRAFVNGEAVGGCALGELGQSRCVQRPVLFTVPASMWRVGVNRLDVEVLTGDPIQNGLSEVLVAPADRLAAGPFRWEQFVRVDILQALTWLTLSLSLLSLPAAWFGRRSPVLSWFAISGLANATVNTMYLRPVAVLPPEALDWTMYACRAISLPFLILTVVQIFERLRPSLKWGLLAYAVLAPVVIAQSDGDRQVAFWVFACLVPVYVAGLPLMLRWTAQSRRPLHAVLTLAGCLLAYAALADWWQLRRPMPIEGAFVMAYASSVLILLVGGMLGARLAWAFSEVRQRNAELEQRVRERTAELERVYRERSEVQAQRSRQEERERLLQDMHDGFGSQLASARLRIEHGELGREQLVELLSECMADLNLVVDTFGQDSVDLGAALADLRFRLTRRLADLPLRLHWQVELDTDPPRSPRQILQILRIVQEALNNAVKHSRAANLWIRAQARPDGGLQVSVADDGVGWPAQTNTGRGLQHMRQRAREIGATLAYGPRDGGGASVRLELPTAGSAPAPGAA